MSTRDKVRLWIELAIAAGLMALGSVFVRYAHGDSPPQPVEVRTSCQQ